MATKPEHFKGIVKGSDLTGKSLVDHGPDLTSEHHPDSQNLYRSSILYSPQEVKKLSGKVIDNGITRKTLYEVPKDHPTHAGTKFMVKPYFEKTTRATSKWQHKYPLAGWSELTNQALYHAGGIGHLHQKVHASEHDMGPGMEREPALNIELEPNLQSINYNFSYFPAGHYVPHPNYEDAHKIGLMDFLTGNRDRHAGNVLERKDGSGLLALDHSRSFHYKAGGKGGFLPPSRVEDSLKGYVKDSALPTRTDGKTYDERQENQLSWGPAFDWWHENSSKIRAKMKERLRQIKDSTVKDHIQRNFDERAKLLDDIGTHGIENFGDDWYNQTVPIYKPGELTDQELEEKHWREQYDKESK